MKSFSGITTMNVITCMCIFILVRVDAGRILVVVPTPSVSHQVVFQPLIRELVKRGHDVVSITTDPLHKGNGPPNLIEIDVRNVSYETWKKSFMVNKAIGKKEYLIPGIKLFVEQFSKAVEVQLRTENVQKLIRGDLGTFDVLILEASVRPALIFSHIFKAPVIQMCTFGAMLNSNDIVGAPSHPLLYPWNVHQRLYNLSFWDKLQELTNHWRIDQLYANYEAVEEEMLRKILGPDIPSLQELSENVQMMFYNSDSLWAESQPVPPNVVYVGGINKKPQKELPKDLQSYLDASRCVIYMSFGNNVKPSLLPSSKIQMFTKVFSELPCNVLWRWDADVNNKPDNVKVMRWVPQTDLLRHPKVRLFITQGGLQSAEEAIDAGVPLVAVPMIADQWFNAEKFEHFNIGRRLDIETSTIDDFRTVIQDVLFNDSYRNHVMKLRRLSNDQPESALSRAVWWTEYVLRHGGAKHLRSPAANMPAAAYYEMPLVLLVLSSIVIFIALIVSFIVYIGKMCLRVLSRNKIKVN